MSSPSVLKIPADVFRALDEFHQAAAVVLERRGRVKIINDVPKAGDGIA